LQDLQYPEESVAVENASQCLAEVRTPLCEKAGDGVSIVEARLIALLRLPREPRWAKRLSLRPVNSKALALPTKRELRF